MLALELASGQLCDDAGRLFQADSTEFEFEANASFMSCLRACLRWHVEILGHGSPLKVSGVATEFRTPSVEEIGRVFMTLLCKTCVAMDESRPSRSASEVEILLNRDHVDGLGEVDACILVERDAGRVGAEVVPIHVVVAFVADALAP